MAGLCWVITKLRHIVKATTLPTVIYTDHAPALQIATQSSMTAPSLSIPRTHELLLAGAGSSRRRAVPSWETSSDRPLCLELEIRLRTS